MNRSLNRRTFLGATAAGVALGVSASRGDQPSAKDGLIVGVMGTGGRGTEHARLFAEQPGVTVAYVCDVDLKRANSAAEAVAKIGGKPPQAVQDFRRILDDKKVDILTVATCNHWHAPATILACAAGKHVYVEKPCSHNPHEGELMVAAARNNKRFVQMGNQRRSWPKIIEAMDQLHKGVIGRVYLAQSWYYNLRPSIGHGREASIPEGLDYDLWQGPAPRRPFKSNYLHYNWHWFWHWGNGELGNNGIHMIDLCRWGLGVDYPVRVVSSGGRYRYDDDQETPDTHLVSFEFPGKKTITWTGFSCNRAPAGKEAEVIFLGEKGSLVIAANGYSIHEPKGKEIQKVSDKGTDAMHIGNFLDAIRTGKALNSEIEEGHKSTLLCHLGNIAQRTGRTLTCDPKDGRILGDKDALALWQREYEKGWEPKV
jgi:predicted dehydrogenase